MAIRLERPEVKSLVCHAKLTLYSINDGESLKSLSKEGEYKQTNGVAA